VDARSVDCSISVSEVQGKLPTKVGHLDSDCVGSVLQNNSTCNGVILKSHVSVVRYPTVGLVGPEEFYAHPIAVVRWLYHFP